MKIQPGRPNLESPTWKAQNGRPRMWKARVPFPFAEFPFISSQELQSSSDSSSPRTLWKSNPEGPTWMVEPGRPSLESSIWKTQPGFKRIQLMLCWPFQAELSWGWAFRVGFSEGSEGGTIRTLLQFLQVSASHRLHSWNVMKRESEARKGACVFIRWAFQAGPSRLTLPGWAFQAGPSRLGLPGWAFQVGPSGLDFHKVGWEVLSEL